MQVFEEEMVEVLMEVQTWRCGDIAWFKMRVGGNMDDPGMSCDYLSHECKGRTGNCFIRGDYSEKQKTGRKGEIKKILKHLI